MGPFYNWNAQNSDWSGPDRTLPLNRNKAKVRSQSCYGQNLCSCASDLVRTPLPPKSQHLEEMMNINPIIQMQNVFLFSTWNSLTSWAADSCWHPWWKRCWEGRKQLSNRSMQWALVNALFLQLCIYRSQLDTWGWKRSFSFQWLVSVHVFLEILLQSGDGAVRQTGFTFVWILFSELCVEWGDNFCSCMDQCLQGTLVAKVSVRSVAHYCRCFLITIEKRKNIHTYARKPMPLFLKK